MKNYMELVNRNRPGYSGREEVHVLDDGGVEFIAAGESAKDIQVEFESDLPGEKVKVTLVRKEDGRMSVTLYDIPEGFYLINWFFDGVERVCASVPVAEYEGKLRNYIELGAR